MNTFHFTTSTANRAAISRSQLSPLARRAAKSAARTTKGAASLLARVLSPQSPFRVTESPTLSLWSPGVLDRLQPIVTRYHE